MSTYSIYILGIGKLNFIALHFIFWRRARKDEIFRVSLCVEKKSLKLCENMRISIAIEQFLIKGQESYY